MQTADSPQLSAIAPSLSDSNASYCLQLKPNFRKQQKVKKSQSSNFSICGEPCVCLEIVSPHIRLSRLILKSILSFSVGDILIPRVNSFISGILIFQCSSLSAFELVISIPPTKIEYLASKLLIGSTNTKFTIHLLYKTDHENRQSKSLVYTELIPRYQEISIAKEPNILYFSCYLDCIRYLPEVFAINHCLQ